MFINNMQFNLSYNTGYKIIVFIGKSFETLIAVVSQPVYYFVLILLPH